MTTPADLPASDPDADRPHKPADDTEEIYFEGSPVFRWELARGWYWLLLGLALLVVPILVKLLWPDAEPWWVIPIGVVLALLFILIPWLQTKTIRYKVSNYRIDFEKGLIGKKFDTLELWHVEDIQLTQSVLDRLLGVGTITIHSHDDTTPHLYMYGLPKPRPIFDSLKQRIIAVKRQRGVIKMDTGSMDTGDVGGHGHG
jgi:membrane protein YdbS with pleckstrin-like domain